MKKIVKALIICAVLLTTFLINVRSKSTVKVVQADDSIITINCASTVPKPKSMIGFLLSVNAQSPSASFINPLNPRLWRTAALDGAIADRIQQSGATPIFIVSDVFKYPGSHRAQPFVAEREWQDTVKRIFTKHSIEGRSVIYDLWNEPNGKTYWSGTKTQFFSAFKKGYDQIRSMPNGNNALISGPSINTFDPVYIQDFLDYCLQNNIKLDVLTWHEFKAGDDIPRIADDIRLAKAKFTENPAYAALGIKSIQINEIIPQSDMLSPASILTYFMYLEQGGADGACKACWVESNGKSNCRNNSLDGLLDPVTLQPRAAWWAYRYYNLSLNNRLRYGSHKRHISCIANYQSNNKLQILVSYFGTATTNPPSTNLNISLTNMNSLSGFSSKSNVRVKVSIIPNTGESVLDHPKPVFTTTGQISGGNLKVAVPQINLNEVCIIEVS